MSEKQKDAGALWLNVSKTGTKYMSGSVEIDGVKTKIVVFKNNYKEEEKHPDYKIYLSTPREGAHSATPPEEVSPYSSQNDSIPF